ncbi:hypothetical protein [Cellulosilyticum sp. I15G10I2]|uniref:hypothetical protein n=1 Tax=Cellulosilyticum sp. I15G10I2 TaxID=1892843 RepID=UPI00085C9D95|nr:hypothetical protein [Cellulosilyticum sp. I15G10I2]
MGLKEEYKGLIKYYLKNYEAEMDQLELISEDIIYGVNTGFIDGSRGNAISNKTEKSALKMMEERENETEKWLEVIKYTLEHFNGTEYEKVIDLTFKEQYQLPKILRILHMSKNPYYDMVNEVVYYAALKATELGLLKH